MENEITIPQAMSVVCNNLMNHILVSDSLLDLKTIVNDYRAELTNIIGDINKLSRDDLYHLGFAKWDDTSDLLLVPLWFYPLLEEGTVLTSIHGSEAIVGEDDIDMDTRFGALAYGVIRK